MAIMRGGCSEVGNGVDDGVLLIDSIVSLIAGGASSSVTSVTKFAMRLSKISFKLIPSFVGGDVALPNLAVSTNISVAWMSCKALLVTCSVV